MWYLHFTSHIHSYLKSFNFTALSLYSKLTIQFVWHCKGIPSNKYVLSKDSSLCFSTYRPLSARLSIEKVYIASVVCSHIVMLFRGGDVFFSRDCWLTTGCVLLQKTTNFLLDWYKPPRSQVAVPANGANLHLHLTMLRNLSTESSFTLINTYIVIYQNGNISIFMKIDSFFSAPNIRGNRTHTNRPSIDILK